MEQETQIAKLDPIGLQSYATEIAALEFTEPRLRFTRDELVSIAERLPDGTTMQEFKTFVTISMMTGAHPVLNEIYLIKYKKKDGGYYPATIIHRYHWYMREARKEIPGLVHTAPLWYDQETGTWSEVWPHDPKVRAPYQGKIGIKTPEMDDYEWIALRWDERFKMNPYGKPQGEWGNQPTHMMEKCLLKKADERFMPPRLQGITTEIEHRTPVDAEGEWTDEPTVEGAIDAGKRRAAINETTQRSREGKLDDAPPVLPRNTQARLSELFKKVGLKVKDDYMPVVNECLKAHDFPTVESPKNLTPHQAAMVITSLENMAKLEGK